MAKSKQQSFRKNATDNVETRPDPNLGKQTELLEGINSKLTELQAATELVAETVENTANRETEKPETQGVTLAQLLESNKSTNDGLRTLNKRSNEISNKLSSIFKQLRTSNGKLTNTNNMLSKILKDITPDSPKPKLPAPEDSVVPKPKEPDSPSNIPPGKPPKSDPKDDKAKRPVGRPPKAPDSLSDKLGKTLDKGFTSLINQGNTISKLLLDITITAALNAAKTVAIFVGIIFAVDVLRMKFEYYSKLMHTSLSEFNDKAGKWAPLLEDILTGVDGIVKAVEDLSPMEFAKAIGSFIGKMLHAEIALLGLGLSKLTAAIMRLIPGMGDMADTTEGMGLSQYQEETGAQLTGKDADLASKYNVQKAQDDYINKKRNDGKFMGDWQNSDKSRFGRMPTKEDYLADAPAYIKNGDVETQKDLDKANAYIKQNNDSLDYSLSLKTVGTTMNDMKETTDKLQKESPEAYASIKPQLDAVNKKFLDKQNNATSSSTIKPDNPKTSQVVQQERNIVNTTNNNKSSNTTQGVPNTGNVDVTNVKSTNNNHIYTVQTQTATVAPGMHRSMNVN